MNLSSVEKHALFESLGENKFAKRNKSLEKVLHPSKWCKEGWKLINKSDIKKSYLNKRDFVGNYSLERSKEDLESIPRSSYDL